ncbi:MAG: four helix bundle protein [Ignavibacteria bacterium]|jgi:four helix bundle protein|nr:four helix bundle protein [Ignavibacteria bacterium]MCU7503718.1 four helix bundle protein [Ignavibacteria bacterium]MCU7517636.1 four helix bundle protein [Ignavibacteria bacterium]
MSSLVAAKTFTFSLHIIDLYKVLKSKGEFVLSRQLLRSGTSIGANVEEATAAQTRKDFLAKICIASKEAYETRYWLKLLNQSQLIKGDYNCFLKEIEEITKILTAIVKTTQNAKPKT